jgi:hydrogenase expression/formation protein HypE
MIGKVPPDKLTDLILNHTGAPDDDIIMGPHYGEDASAIKLDDTTILVISTDPISLAAQRIGTLGVFIASNDIAASGATPRWLTNTMFLPTDDDALITDITTQLHTASTTISVSIVGGHSEYLPDLDRPMLCLTCFHNGQLHPNQRRDAPRQNHLNKRCRD